MMNDFITTENIDSFFEYVTKAKGNNLELTLQIIRLLLPLHISIEVNQSQFLESLKKNIMVMKIMNLFLMNGVNPKELK